MKLLLLLLLIQCVLRGSSALNCRKCASEEPYQGEQGSCYGDKLKLGNSQDCGPGSGGTEFYCRTKFTMIDGFPFAVERDCVLPLHDQDESTNDMPGNPQCVANTTALTEHGLEAVVCYYSCNDGPECSNNFHAKSLKTCNKTCTPNGFCNYLNGSCQCFEGYSGEGCAQTSNATYRQCVQCSGDVESGCQSLTDAKQCPESTDTLNFCSVSKTVTLNADGSKVRSSVVKACTDSMTYTDECFFSNTEDKNFGDFVEFTCTSTCGEDECNGKLPDGKLDDTETKGFYCVVCEENVGSGNCSLVTQRALCPPSHKFCKTSVVYYTAVKSDIDYQEYPDHIIRSVIRECAEEEVVPTCSSSSLGGLSAQKVTCIETCSTDGCNIGWPARPKCNQCESGYFSSNDDSCLLNPPLPKPCDLPIEAYCTIQESSRKLGMMASTNDQNRRIRRSCNYHDIGNQCETVTTSGIEIETCNKTCDTDGCNQDILFGAAPKTSHCNLALLMMMMSAWSIFGIA